MKTFDPYPEQLFMIQIMTTADGESHVEKYVNDQASDMSSVLPGCASNHSLAVYKFVGTRPFDELYDEEEAKVKEEAKAKLALPNNVRGPFDELYDEEEAKVKEEAKAKLALPNNVRGPFDELYDEEEAKRKV